jgi:ATP-dependent helicase/nuclease subunit A
MMQLDFKDVYRAIQISKESFYDLMNKKIAFLVGEKCFTEEEINVIRIEKILAFFQSEIGIRACKAEEIYKEAPFSIIREVNGEEIIVQGIIDCYFKEGAEYILLDYKTKHIENKENAEELQKISETYKEQIKIYSQAIKEGKGIYVKEAYLYLFSADMEMRVSLE